MNPIEVEDDIRQLEMLGLQFHGNSLQIIKMVQNVILSSRNNSLVIAGNNSSDFVNWLSEKFKTPVYLLAPTIKGIMNIFDTKEHNGVVFRGELLEWLWANQGEEATLEIK